MEASCQVTGTRQSPRDGSGRSLQVQGCRIRPSVSALRCPKKDQRTQSWAMHNATDPSAMTQSTLLLGPPKDHERHTRSISNSTSSVCQAQSCLVAERLVSSKVERGSRSPGSARTRRVPQLHRLVVGFDGPCILKKASMNKDGQCATSSHETWMLGEDC